MLETFNEQAVKEPDLILSRTAVSGPVTIVLFGHRESQSVDWLIRLVNEWPSMRIRDQFSEFPIGSL